MTSTRDFDLIYQLCIIGGGPAGIILALEYARLNPQKKVLIVDYGYDHQPSKNNLDDSIKNLNPINHHAPYECTNKGFGGSTTTWGGRCVMYDEVDFENRDALSGECTWNNGILDTIKQYTPVAANYFECGEPFFNLHNIANIAYAPIAENFIEGIVTDSAIERWSTPTRFGKRYRNEIIQHTNITLLEGFEARDFSEPNVGTVDYITIRDVKTSAIYNVRAAQFIIASGGQETTRILLRNQNLFKQIGGVPKSLGKFYQGHLSGKIASVKFKGDPKKTDYGFLIDKDETYLRRRFQFSKDFLIENDLLNTAIWLDNPLYFDPDHHSGAMSFMYLAMITPFLGKKLAPPAIAHSITKGKINRLHMHLWNIIKDFPRSLFTPAGIFYKRYVLKRKLPGVFLYSSNNTYALHFHAEQTPDSSNRMELDEDNETLIIRYGFNDTDINSVIKLHETLDNWLRQCNCGELEYWFKKEHLADAIKSMSRDGLHQCGTTRISTSANNGVVNEDLLLWGTNNVFVCSSSVFPTSGQANPTFMLGAFAAKLAKHLSDTIK